MPKKFETRGVVVLSAAVALAAAGLLMVDGVLLALGTAAAIWLGVTAFFAWSNLRLLEVALEGPRVIRAGERFRLGVTVSNRRRWLDAVGLRVRLEGPGGVFSESDVPWVMANDASSGELGLMAEGRGNAKEMRYSIRSSFPWGLLGMETGGTVPMALTVLPRPVVPLELLRGGSDREKDGFLDSQGRESFGIPHGLREFRAGDRLRDVAWSASVRALARGTGLVVREWDPPRLRPRQVTVLFHSYGANGELIRPDRFERAISLAWGALGHLQAGGVEIQWRADFDAWVPVNIENKRELGTLGDRLAGCRREASTEGHELELRLQECRGEVWVVSDMPSSSWRHIVDEYHGVRVIDVTRFEKGRRLNFEGRSHA